jgi:hypothetical protein
MSDALPDKPSQAEGDVGDDDLSGPSEELGSGTVGDTADDTGDEED